MVFEQHDVEIPKPWSQLATNVVVSKYFRGPLGTPQREHSVRQLISRVVDTITGWGRTDGYFASEADAQAFADELTHLLVEQKLAFNSPVWFNVGVEPHPQCSACFILSVEDRMESILDWYRKEGIIFKGGSGSGVNLSRIRSSKERLAGGGTASGPVSFMRAADASAGVIKSGGKTRRAAKMVVLNADHPDIVEFIQCKAEEERKAWTLIEAGYDASIDGAAYSSIFFQNANNSVRVTDDFMRAVVENRPWSTRFITTGDICETFQARDLLRQIAEATWRCGDPGMQFDTTINAWHTCANTGRINASNPCSEYMHLDDSACNLASLNLMKFLRDDGGFDTTAFKHAVDISITAQDIIVDNSSYPTVEIAVNARAFRELGLGYANLGAMLMSLGLPYDSEAGRQYAGAITALMTGEAYLQSARLAEQMGPFSGYAVNREPMLGVIDKHRTCAHRIDPSLVSLDLLSEARKVWDEALALGRKVGYRNSQATVLAPTGTIAFMMDCDTTGVEPDIALVKYKRLVGGGLLKIVNNTVPRALKRLGYDSKDVQAIIEYIDEHETIEGAPLLRDEHLPVFDCAFKPTRGSRSIHYLGHLRMMGAVQPFISGAISKTINMSNDATVDDIIEAYMEAWRLGLKAVAIYRDGCKRVQPLATGEKKAEAQPAVAVKPTPVRRRLPMDRQAICHKFEIAGHEGYIHVGFYEDGTPGEIFIKMAKEGSTISGLMDTIATLTSLSLQYGVPLEALVSKFSHVRFEPSGFTQNPDIPYAKSLTDYIFRFLGTRFLSTEQKQETGLVEREEQGAVENESQASPKQVLDEPQTSPGQVSDLPSTGPRLALDRPSTPWQSQADAPSCADCGSIMIRNGSCYKCLNCGATSGCS
jgi:ribonucleoside-diphosphate reductase alpha chain